MQEQVERLIETLAQFPGQPALEAGGSPSSRLWDGRDEVRIAVDLPGVEKDALRVAVSRGLLEITGTRAIRPVEGEAPLQLRYAEHPYGKFRRTMRFPHGARIELLKADLRDGVLELRIPKEVETVEIKTVPVG